MPIFMPEERVRELIPPGAHLGICCSVVDLGTQQTQYGAKKQLNISFELPDERRSDGRPHVVGKTYNMSSDERGKLRIDVEGWLGRPLNRGEFGKLDLGERLGSTAQLAIAHRTSNVGRTSAAIVSVMRPPTGTPARLGLSKPGVLFSLNQRPLDMFAYDQLPQWLKELVAKSPEFAAAINAQAGSPLRTTDHLHERLATAPTPSPVTPFPAAAAAPVPEEDDLDDFIPL
jgi:hypothetical protein